MAARVGALEKMATFGPLSSTLAVGGSSRFLLLPQHRIPQRTMIDGERGQGLQ
jgi:hypothetical protein